GGAGGRSRSARERACPPLRGGAPPARPRVERHRGGLSPRRHPLGPLRAPDAVALVQGEDELTYGELSRRARELGTRLRSLGVGPDVPVALALPRGFDLIAGLLGVLEAGGAYVPLDLTHPEERRDFILRDTGAAVVVTEGLELSPGEIGPIRPIRPIGPIPTPGNLACILHTSGSTGMPKGVAVTRRNVARLVFGTSMPVSDRT